jgi:TPR repeat protein
MRFRWFSKKNGLLCGGLRRRARCQMAEALAANGAAATTATAVEAHEAAAVQWLSRAAECGHPMAQTHVGLLLASGGGGLARSGEGAVRWFRAAADQGYGAAQVVPLLAAGALLPPHALAPFPPPAFVSFYLTLFFANALFSVYAPLKCFSFFFLALVRTHAHAAV